MLLLGFCWRFPLLSLISEWEGGWFLNERSLFNTQGQYEAPSPSVFRVLQPQAELHWCSEVFCKATSPKAILLHPSEPKTVASGKYSWLMWLMLVQHSLPGQPQKKSDKVLSSSISSLPLLYFYCVCLWECWHIFFLTIMSQAISWHLMNPRFPHPLVLQPWLACGWGGWSEKWWDNYLAY